MGSSVLAELVALIRDHPYVSCSSLVFLTPPFWPILKFFSPLLISTALFLVALVTMGPQFEDPSEQELELQNSPEFNAEDEMEFRAEDVTRDVKRKKSSKDIRSSLSDWVSSCKESGLMWAEQKLRNENFRAVSLNDENVSILQEAFSQRVEEKPRLMVKLLTRRIPAEEESGAEERHLQRQGVPELSNSGSWNSFHGSSGRSFETPPSFIAATNTRDLPHDFFAPHPSLSRRLNSDTSIFDNVEPLPIEHDMPPQITGPASVVAPLFKYIEDASDSDGYDHHHSDHDEDMHLEFGEPSLDAESLSQDELSLVNGTHGQLPPFTVQEEDLPSSSGSDEGRHYFAESRPGHKEVETSLPASHNEVHSPGGEEGRHYFAESRPGNKEVETSLPARHNEVHSLSSDEGRHYFAESRQGNKEVETSLPTRHNEVHSRDGDEGRHYFAESRQGNKEVETSLPARHNELHSRDESIASHANDVSKQQAPSAEILQEERSVPAPVIHDENPPSVAPAHEESPQINDDTELHDMPELEDVLPVENEVLEAPAAVEKSSGLLPGDLHPGVILGDVPIGHQEPDVPGLSTDQAIDSEAFYKDAEVHSAARVDVPVEPHHFVERSISLPVAGSLATAESLESDTAHEDLAQLDSPLPDVQEPAHQSRVLGNAISLPAGSHPIHPLIIPPKTVDQGPLSPDTDLGYATTPERRGVVGRFFAAERYNSITSMSGDESEFATPTRVLSNKEKLFNLEYLGNSMPSPSSGESSSRRSADISLLRATTDEQVSHVSDKLRGFIEDSPSKKFQPDAPQLQITPPSKRVSLNVPPSKSAILASALGRPSIRPAVSSTRTSAMNYSSSEESSGDEQIQLDSDPEDDDSSESDSDFETLPARTRLKFPGKLLVKILTPEPVVHGKKIDAEPVKK